MQGEHIIKARNVITNQTVHVLNVPHPQKQIKKENDAKVEKQQKIQENNARLGV